MSNRNHTGVGRMVLAGFIATIAIATPADAQKIITFTGQNAGDTFGWHVSPAGDVNHDGIGDILVGAPTFDTPADYAGRVYLYHGPFTGVTVPVSQADAVFRAQEFGDNLGVAVKNAGDLNNDGFADILLGARGYDHPGIQSGRVYYFEGPVSGNINVTQADAIFEGQAFDEVGWTLAGGFDLNGDAIKDVAMGAPLADNVGNAHVFFGPISGAQSTSTADATIVGAMAFEDLGDALAVADLDDDGHDDLIVGAPHAPFQVSVPGRVYIFFGPLAGTHSAAAADIILEGEGLQDRFGISLDVGDVNGDGRDDLIVGADQFYIAATGKAYVFYGPLGEGFFTAAIANAVLLSEDFDNIVSNDFAVSVACAGDVNADGFDDVLIGDTTAEDTSSGDIRSGAAYVFRGPLKGTLSASQANQILTGLPLDYLGQCVAGAGDLDGNGVDDLLLGAPADSFSTIKAGKAVLVLSRPPGDLDNDGDVDIADFRAFGLCLGGPDITQPPPGVDSDDFAAADFDSDHDADLADAARFQLVF